MAAKQAEIDLKTMHHKLRHVFWSMKSSCYNPQHKAYKYYGRLGATICPAWMKDGKPDAFITWALSSGYQLGYHLVRLDKALPYGPSNCKFVLAKESRRTSNAKPLYVEYKGERVTLVSLVERFYPNYSLRLLATIKKRVNDAGWDAESAVTIPITNSCKQRKGAVRIKAPRQRYDNQEDGWRKGKLLSWYYSLRNKTTNPKEPGYKYYGAHGIAFSPQWATVDPFVEWALANNYQPGMMLVRIDKHLPYGPDNCRLVLREEKRRANANAQYVEYKGEWVVLIELVERVYPDHGRLLLKQIKTRIYMLGWDVETAVDTPIHPAGLHIRQENAPNPLKIDKRSIEWF